MANTVDNRVLQVQNWLKENYSGKTGMPEVVTDGHTGNATMKALISALQIELGVSVDGVFGSEVMNKFITLYKNHPDEKTTKMQHLIYILQGGLFCKGVTGSQSFNGAFDTVTETAVKTFQSWANLSNKDGKVDAKLMKALLNTEAYVLVSDGSAKVQEFQKRLNNRYADKINEIIPCDGRYSRVINKAVIKAIQIEQGLTGKSVDGIWGPTTMAKCPTIKRYATISNKEFVYILQGMLYCYGYDPKGFDGGYGAGAENVVKEFQKFSALTADGIVGQSTWASLMVSYGDKNRKGTACDCSTRVTTARANTLKNNGVKIVGRYLTQESSTSEKAMVKSEITALKSAGLRVFPIYQAVGRNISYFSINAARRDARRAFNAANNLGYPKNTIIYFAVDYDVLVAHIPTILNYFRKINELFATADFGNNKYKIGVYAPRKVCTELCKNGLTTSSFVCDMSSGFTCNIGYLLPENWAFDQISTVSYGSGEAKIEIDNNIVSGKYTGVSLTDFTETTVSQKDINRAIVGKAYEMLRGTIFDDYLENYSGELSIDKTYTIIDNSNCKIQIGIATGISAGKGKVKLNIVNGEFDSVSIKWLDQFSTEVASDKIGKEVVETLKHMTTVIENGAISFAVSVDNKQLRMEMDIQNYDFEYNNVDASFTTKLIVISKYDNNILNKAMEMLPDLSVEQVAYLCAVILGIAALASGVGEIATLLEALLTLLQMAMA